MKKILGLVIIFTFVCGFRFSADEIDISKYLNVQLTAMHDSVVEGRELQFELNFSSDDIDLELADLSGQKIAIDFSQIVDTSVDISVSADSEIFSTNVSDEGAVTITFNDLSSETETVTSLSGSIYIMVTAKQVDADTNVVVMDSLGNATTILIADTGIRTNTTVVSTPDYVNDGDTAEYTMWINGDGNEITNFSLEVEPAQGLRLVEDDFYALTDITDKDVTDYFTFDIDSSGKLIIKNTTPLLEPIYLHFNVEVVSEYPKYKSQFDAYYDSLVPETLYAQMYLIQDTTTEVEETSGTIEITNLDDENNRLANSKFDIINSTGDVVDQLVTDDTGYAKSKDLALGVYDVKQTSVNSSYNLNPKLQNVELKFETTLAEVSFTNSAVAPEVKQVGTIKVENIGEDSEPIENAKFEIFDENGISQGVVTTDENGIGVKKELPIGEYKVSQVTPGYGYTKNTKSQSIVVSQDKQTSAQFISAVDDNYTINIHLVTSSGYALGGVSFGIYDENGNLIQVIVTDENGNASSSILPEGKYTIKQLSSVDGYELNDKEYYIEIGGGSKPTMYEIQNQELSGTIQLRTTDQFENPISGAIYDVYNIENEVIAQLTTNKNGIAINSSIPFGSFYIMESYTPPGYELNKQIYSFTIDDQHHNIKVNIDQVIITDQYGTNSKVSTSEPKYNLVTTSFNTRMRSIVLAVVTALLVVLICINKYLKSLNS